MTHAQDEGRKRWTAKRRASLVMDVLHHTAVLATYAIRSSLTHERINEVARTGVIQLEEYRRRRQDLEQQQQSLDQQGRQLDFSIDRQIEVRTLVASVEAFCGRIQAGLQHASFEQQRQLIDLVVDRVVVTNDDVEIR